MRNEATITEAWLRELRARFIEVARRRVSGEAVEDVVQDALTIVYRKQGHATEDPAALAWSFLVLRNVIGNHYQKEKTRRRASGSAPSFDGEWGNGPNGGIAPTPLESLERVEVARLLHDAVHDLGRSDPHCGRQFRRMLGSEPAVDEPDAEVRDSTHYVRHFRCREKLRKILLQRGFRP